MLWLDFQNPQIIFSQGTDTACEESLATVESRLCPRNKADRDAAAAKKNCRSRKNSCRSFEYHCVINEWMNGTVEVCAPSMIIQKSKCAEFSTGFKSIRINFLTDCTMYDPPCPAIYNSTEAYRYASCYDMTVVTSFPTTTLQVTTMMDTTFMENSTLTTTRGMKKMPTQSEFSVLAIVIPVVIVILSIVAAGLVFIFRKRIPKQSSGERSSKSRMEDVPLNT